MRFLDLPVGSKFTLDGIDPIELIKTSKTEADYTNYDADTKNILGKPNMSKNPKVTKI